MNKKPELLAPAGNMEAVYAAVNAGADAVYLAGNKFGARAYADNLSNEEIILAIEYAHLFGIKIYLTVNTLVKERELESLCVFLETFYSKGLDGVIVQDLGAAKTIRDSFPAIAIHASTQMSVTSPGEVNMLYNFGFKRIIPSRELTIEEIYKLISCSPAEIEIFIHGAMCYSYSGQCLFSSMLGDRSANRGRCAAPCRQVYSYKGSPKKYMLSLKDMMSIEYLPELIDMGVSSFKIEGRMKPPLYTAGITSVYRKYIDIYVKHKNKPLNIDKEDAKLLSSLYIRSGTECGYIGAKRGKDMVSLDSPAYTETDFSIFSAIESRYIKNKRKIKLNLKIKLIVNSAAELIITYNNIQVNILGSIVESPKNAPLCHEGIKRSIAKLGNTEFEAEDIVVYMPKPGFIPVSELNRLRREGVIAIRKEILNQYQNR